MKKLRYGAMSVAIILGVCAFLAFREFAPLPAWASRGDVGYRAYMGDAAALTEAIQHRPNDYMAFYRRGIMLYQQQNYPSALADLSEAVSLSPIPLSASNAGEGMHSRERRVLNRVFLVLTARAQVLLQMQRPQEALADFDRAIALDAQKWDVYYQRGYAHLAAGTYDAAVADFGTLLARRPESQAYFGRGLSHYLTGRWAAAQADFLQAATLEPSSEVYALWLTRAYLRGDVPLEYEHLSALQNHTTAWTFVQTLMSDEEPQPQTAFRVAAVPASAAMVCKQALLRGEWLSLRDQDAREAYNVALTNCAPFSTEHILATAELRRTN